MSKKKASTEPDRKGDPNQEFPSELEAEKAALLIEKLRLDNQEQEARIVQLQLKWWQKPIGIFAMILPLVPLMVTGAAAVANQWSEQAKSAAKAEQDLALIEKQGYELENKRLGNVKAKIEFENDVLRFEQRQLRLDQATLAKRIDELSATEKQLVDGFFKRYVNVCGIGGKIVTAHDYESAAVEYAKFDAFDILAIDAKLADPIKSVAEQLEQWKTTNQRPNETLEDAVLEVSLACKNAFNNRRNEQFQRPILELTIGIYEEAEKMVQSLQESQDFADAQQTVDRFWELYYGKLVLVESPGVESVMVRSGRALKAWTDGPPNTAVLKGLSETFRTEYQTLIESLRGTITDPGAPDLGEP